MSSIKNEHIVYAYVELLTGEYILVIGISDIGIDFLREESGNYLTIDPPSSKFYDVKKVLVIQGKTKAELHKTFAQIAKITNEGLIH